MTRMKFTQLAGVLTLSLSAYIVPTMSVNAQEVEFADDFSQDSIRFSAGTFDGSSGIFSVTPSNDGLLLSTSALDSNSPGNLFLDIQDRSDSMGMDITQLSNGSIVVEDAFVDAHLEAVLYRDSPEASDQNGAGNVWAQLAMVYDQSMTPEVFYCLSRENESGDLIEFPNACGFMENTGVAIDERAELKFALNRDSREVTFSANDVTVNIDIDGEIFTPVRQFKRIGFRVDNREATANALLHEVRLGDETIDMAANPPVFDRYYTNFNLGATVGIVNEKLAVEAVSQPEDDFSTNVDLQLLRPTDYIEAEFVLSSESDVSMRDHQAFAVLQGMLFNTQADGGVDNLLGDVRSSIYLEARGDGLRRVEICLQRFDDAEGDNRTGLLNPDEPDNRCDNLPLLLEFDTPYRASIGLDRATSSITFRVNEIVQSIPLDSEIFNAANPEGRFTIGASNGGTAIGTIDNIRTAPERVTATEQAEGVTLPAPFPEPVDPGTIQVDSTIAHPFEFFDDEPRLDFIDDFSGITSDFGFWGGRDRGGSGVSWSDGSIKLETNVAADNDGSNFTEFYLDPKTDLLEAVVSLSSESRFVPGNTGADLSIRATFYNDTQDFGFNDNEGDLEASMSLQFEGDGRMRLRVRLSRRDSNGDTGDNLLDDLVEFEDGLAAIIPNLDQQYKLSIAIDRISGVIRYGVDDQFTDYQIPTDVFLPAQRRVLISVNHQRGTGVAIGRIHSVRTDTIDEDFSTGAPVLAPYRPTFNAQYPGRLVEVIDSRLRLEADGALASGFDPRIAALSGSDYIGSSIELSSESVIAAEGRVFIGVHGSMYNDLPGGVVEEGSGEGLVFAAVRITADGNGERYVQYCAFRFNNSDFSDDTELLGGDPENCPRFATVPEFDTAYPAFIRLDRVASTLTFGFNGEIMVHNITTPINNVPPFHGVRARTTDDSKVVAWADYLSFAENPVPLAESASALVQDVSASVPVVVDTETPSTESSSGGGGAFGPAGLLLVLFPMICSLRRRNAFVK